MKANKLMKHWALSLCMAFTGLLHAQLLTQAATVAATAPLANMQSEPQSEASTYENRILKRKMVHDMDPNVYAYTAAFAKRFQMPEQWITPDLEGAAAVAFRVMPYYRSCGWGGNPTACKEDETRCMMDVYFDQETQPLPWDPRMRIAEFDWDLTSAGFMYSSANRLSRPKADGKSPLARSPFTDPQTGKELGWQFWNGGWGYLTARSYDREIFAGVSMVTFGSNCLKAAEELWLASEGLNKSAVATSKALRHLVMLPSSWQARVNEVLLSYDQRNRTHFKQVFEEMNKPAPTAASSAAK